MSPLRFVGVALLALSLPAISLAGPPAPKTDPSRLLASHWRPFATYSLGYSQAERLSGALGIIASRRAEAFDCDEVCGIDGPFAQLGLGREAWRADAGWAWTVSAVSERGSIVRRTHVGWGVAAVLLRSKHDDAVLGAEGRNWLGIEGRVQVIGLNLHLALLRGRRAPRESHDWKLSLGFGWGF